MEQQKSTLCWDCQRAVLRMDLYCPWAWNFIPVDGWKAKETKLRAHTGEYTKFSYCVTKCPLFLQDAEKEETKEEKKEEIEITQKHRKGVPLYVVDGEEWTLNELCEAYGIKRQTLYNRMCEKKMTLEEALNFEKSVITIKAFGKEQSAYQWGLDTGIPPTTITDRWKKGWTVERILEVKEDGSYGRNNRKKED